MVFRPAVKYSIVCGPYEDEVGKLAPGPKFHSYVKPGISGATAAKVLALRIHGFPEGVTVKVALGIAFTWILDTVSETSSHPGDPIVKITHAPIEPFSAL